jgi:hypothetical protein
VKIKNPEFTPSNEQVQLDSLKHGDCLIFDGNKFMYIDCGYNTGTMLDYLLVSIDDGVCLGNLTPSTMVTPINAIVEFS